MKNLNIKTILLTLLTILFSFTFTSCEKEDIAPTPITQNTQPIRYEGSHWDKEDVYKYYTGSMGEERPFALHHNGLYLDDQATRVVVVATWEITKNGITYTSFQLQDPSSGNYNTYYTVYKVGEQYYFNNNGVSDEAFPDQGGFTILH